MLKLKHRPKFVYYLTAISIIGALFTIITLLTGYDLNRWSLVAILITLGFALLGESQIRILLKGGINKSEITGHLATGSIGFIALVLGFVLIPFFNIQLVGQVLSFTILVLTFHILSILAEVFWF